MSRRPLVVLAIAGVASLPAAACGGNIATDTAAPDAGSAASVDASTVDAKASSDSGIVLDSGGPGVDGSTCASPSVECAGACVDVQTDPANCGGCGVTCGGTCDNAHCLEQLAAGTGGLIGGEQLALDATNVYWTAGSGVLRVAKTGGPTMTLASSTGMAEGLAVDATDVYFSVGLFVDGGVGGLIDRVPLDGGTVETVASPLEPGWLAVGSGYVVWIDASNATLDALALDGGAPGIIGFDPIYSAVPLILGDNAVFLSQGNGYQIQEVPLSGRPYGSSTVLFASMGCCASSLLADSAALYWLGATDTIEKMPLSGGATTTLPLLGGSLVILGAVDGTSVYFATNQANTISVQSIPAGGGAPTTLLATPVTNITSMAVDATSVYFLAPTGVYKVTPK